MSRGEKLLRRFQSRPVSVRYADIEILLLHLGCEKVNVRGSHVKFKHRKLLFDIIIPVHAGDCKPFYKKQILRQIASLLP